MICQYASNGNMEHITHTNVNVVLLLPLSEYHTGKTILKTTLDTHAHLREAPLERVIKAASKLALSCVAGTSPNRLDETRGQQVHGHMDIVSSL